MLQRLVQRGPDVAPHRVVARQRLVGAFEDDDVLLSRQRPDDGRLGERTEQVRVDRAHLDAPALAHVVDRRFDVLGRRSERHEHRVRIVGLVLGNQAVVAAGQLGEVAIRILEEIENRLDEVVPPGDDALHVVLLVLNRPEQNRIRQVDHLRHAAARRTEEDALALGRTVDDVFRRPEVLANQLRFVLVERPLEMGGEEPVHDVHPGSQTELGDPAKNERLVGGLLRVLAEDDDPPRVERAVHIVVPAVDVQGVLGQRARRNLQHHRGALARSVVILLDAVDDALAGCVVDHALAAHRVRDRAALGGVLAFRFDGDGVVAEDVELALGERLLIKLAALRGRRNRIEHAGVGDACFRVIGHELVAVRGDSDSRVTRSGSHGTPVMAGLACQAWMRTGTSETYAFSRLIASAFSSISTVIRSRSETIPARRP